MAKDKKSKAKHPRDFENMEDVDIINQVLNDFRDSDLFQKQYFDTFRECYKLYRSYISEDEMKENRSNLFIPYTFQVIETVVPKLILTMFSARPYVQAIPLGVLDNQTRTQRAQKMTKLFEWLYTSKIKIVPLVTEIIKTAAIYGTAITKQTWDYEEKEIVKKRQRTVLGIPIAGAFENVLVNSVVKDQPKVELINILDFFFDPAATTIQEGRYAVHRYYEDFHELSEKNRKSNGMYKNLDKYKSYSNDVYARQNENNFMPDAAGISRANNGTKSIEILEYWTDDWVIKVANRETIIYSNPTPFFHRQKPFAKWVYSALPNEFYGEGAVNPIKPLQYELNTTRNQRVDNVSFVLNKMWKVLRSANIDVTQLVSKPAGFIEVDELTDIEEIRFTDVTASSYNEESVIKNDMDMTSGVHDAARGSSPDRRETATTMSILSKAGSERFQLSVRLSETGGFYDMNNQILRLLQQYVDHDLEVMILGDDGKLQPDIVSPEDILGEWDIVAIGSSLEPNANKEIRQTQLVQLYNIIQARPDVNHSALLRNIFEAFDMRNMDEIFNVQQQPMAQQDATQMQGIVPESPAAPFSSSTSFAGGVNNGNPV